MISGKHQGLSQGSLFRLHITLKNALNSAVEDEAIAKNPALFNDAPKRPKKELQFWDEKTAWQFLDYAEGERTYSAFYLAIMTGMRQGQILGLKWSDIDLERKIITSATSRNSRENRAHLLTTD